MDRSLRFRYARDVQLVARVLSTALESKVFCDVSRFPVGVRVLRPLVTAIDKRVTQEELEGVANTETVSADRGTVLEIQSGHTSRTAASNYAGDPSLTITSLSSLSFFRFREASALWHSSLNLASRHGGTVMREPSEGPCVAIAAIEAAGRGAVVAQLLATPTAIVVPPSVPPADSPMLRVHIHVSGPGRVPVASAHKLVDDKVKAVYGSYKSDEQRMAIHEILLARYPQTTPFVLPTGGGKSASFLILVACGAESARKVPHTSAEAAEHGTGLCVGTHRAAHATAAQLLPVVTIVLSPTRAVSPTLAEAAKALGLIVTVWRRGGLDCPASVSLIIVDMSTAVVDAADLTAYLDILNGQSRLARVVVDEVHLVSLWSSFRHHLLHLRSLLSDLPCQLLLLTATAPVELVPTLIASVSLSTSRPFWVLRPVSTRRTNIRYIVEQCLKPYELSPDPEANTPLHTAIAARILTQVDALRNAAGDRQGRSAIFGCVYETVREVDGIADRLCIALTTGGAERHNNNVVVHKFHSTSTSVASHQGTHNGGEGGGAAAEGVRGSSSGPAAASDGAAATGAACAAAAAAARATTTGSHGDDDNVSFLVRELYGNGQRVEQDGGGGGGASPSTKPTSERIFAAALVDEVAGRSGVGVVIVIGSPAVSTGTDFPRMVWALFLGARNMMAFAQASGRLCRAKGIVGTVVVWVPENYAGVLKNKDQTERIPMLDALGSFEAWTTLIPTVCRRLGLDTIMDGVHPDGFVSCAAGGFSMCDFFSPALGSVRARDPQDDGSGGQGGSMHPRWRSSGGGNDRQREDRARADPCAGDGTPHSSGAGCAPRHESRRAG